MYTAKVNPRRPGSSCSFTPKLAKSRNSLRFTLDFPSAKSLATASSAIASFGPMIPCVKDGYNLIFIAREPVVGEKFTAIQSVMRSLLRRANLLKTEEEKHKAEHRAKREAEGAEAEQ